jgi:2',3'-cyclic-nucleotide 2'-phosphodiesterase (5'-nucleotidase family)
MATHYEGMQMTAPYNHLKVDVAMVGNHDFDFGCARMRKAIA